MVRSLHHLPLQSFPPPPPPPLPSSRSFSSSISGWLLLRRSLSPSAVRFLPGARTVSERRMRVRYVDVVVGAAISRHRIYRERTARRYVKEGLPRTSPLARSPTGIWAATCIPSILCSTFAYIFSPLSSAMRRANDFPPILLLLSGYSLSVSRILTSLRSERSWKFFNPRVSSTAIRSCAIAPQKLLHGRPEYRAHDPVSFFSQQMRRAAFAPPRTRKKLLTVANSCAFFPSFFLR